MVAVSTPPKKENYEDEGKVHELSNLQNDLSHDSTTVHGDGHYQTVAADTDTESNSSDEFDWDEADEAASDQPAKTAKRGRRIWQLFIRLARPLRIFLVALLGCGVLITPFIVVLLRFQSVDIVFQHVRAWSIWFAVSWAAACTTALIAHIIPHFVVKIVLAIHGKPPESLLTQLELLMAVTGWLELCLDVSWMWIALSVIRGILHPPGSYWIYINRAMQALFSAAIILLVEKVFLQYVAIQFHKKALAERLAENRLALKCLDRLSNAQPVQRKNGAGAAMFGKRKGNPKDSPSSSRGGSTDKLRMYPRDRSGTISDEDISSNEKHEKQPLKSRQKKKEQKKEQKKKRNTMKKLMLDQLGDAIGQLALKDSKLNRDYDVNGLWSARRLARKLFITLSATEPQRAHLIVKDFRPYFSTDEEAEAAFTIFDKDNNGDITKKEMREAVQRIYRERKALVAGLKDVGSAVAKLDAVLLVLALLAIAFVSLLIFNRTSTVASLVPLATIVLGFSFIFGHSAQLLFESLIFIFSTHVFDVGDLVLIDDQPLLVKEFGLFSTTFRRTDGQEIIAPNTLLASTKLIHNLRRSNSMWETTSLQIAYDTPLEAMEHLKARLLSYVAANNREWNSAVVNIDKMDYQNSITLTVGMEHKSNWQDWGARWARRNGFMRNLKTVLEELEVGYSMPVQPVFLQTSSWAAARAAMENSDKDREELGNAGYAQMGTAGKASGPSIRVAGDTF